MPKMKVAEDIIPIGEFKTHASELLRRLHANRRPLVITQNGRPSAVVLTPEEFDDLGYRRFARTKILAGMESARTSPTASAETVRERVKAKLRGASRDR